MQPVSCKLAPHMYIRQSYRFQKPTPSATLHVKKHHHEPLPRIHDGVHFTSAFEIVLYIQFTSTRSRLIRLPVWIFLIRTHFLLKSYLICNQRYKFRIGRLAFSIVHSISE